MLAIDSSWYSFTPPQWSNIPPPLTPRETLHLGSEPYTACRQVNASLPSIEGIVVAMAYEGAYAGPFELGQTINEAQLGPEAPLRSVVDVAGDQQGIHLLLQAKVDDVLVSVEGSTAQGLGDVVGSLTADAAEGAVKVQVGRMDEAEFGHEHLVLQRRVQGGGSILPSRRAERRLSWERRARSLRS